MDAVALQAGARLIGWALLHFVWQGALVGVLYALLRAALPRGNARYLLGMLALAALALCPVLTGVAIWHGLLPADAGGSVALPDLVVGNDTAADTAGQWLDALLPWLALAWSCGVLLLSVRAWRQWSRLQALLRMAERLPEWEIRLTTLMRQFGLRRPIRILRSAAVAAPALVGWLRPVIVLPVAMLGNLPPPQIEWLLAHELAHLRRWDPVCNLFQLVLETLYFFHPVVHWISRDVRNEREICCDATAIAIRGGDRLDFARALAGLADLRDQHASLLLAANGGLLLERVQRVVEAPGTVGQAPARPLVMALGFILAMLAAATVGRSLAWLPRVAPVIAEPLPAQWRSPSWSLSDLLPVRVQPVRPRSDDVALDAIPLATGALSTAPPRAMRLRVADLAMPTSHGLRLRLREPAPLAVAMPVLAHMRQPVYPQAAHDLGIEGRVVVEFGIDASGRVHDARVVQAQPAGTFDLAALQAMREWRFAAPVASGSTRFRQALVFSLHTPDGAAGAVDARIGCRIVTGTHICRMPEEEQAGDNRAWVAAARSGRS